MVSPQQARQNVASAMRLTAQRLGMFENDGSGFQSRNLSPAEQITLTNAVAAYIVNNPSAFDTGAADLTNPVNSAPLIYNTQLEDTEITSDQLGSALADNLLAAGEKVAGIGNGVLNAAQTASWLIPAAAVVFVGILLYGEYKKRVA